MLIDFQNIDILIDDRPILHNVNLQLNEGDFAYIIGRVGSGKSSLLKAIYGELPVKGNQAQVLNFDMKNLPANKMHNLRRGLGIVFQDFQLLADRTVYENLEFVLRVTDWAIEDRKKRINEVLNEVGIVNKAECYPHELSGGEQQRVAIARALLNHPKLVLADEPTGNLDKETGESIMQLLMDIRKRGTAVMMITHNHALLDEYPASLVLTCEDNCVKNITPQNIEININTNNTAEINPLVF